MEVKAKLVHFDDEGSHRASRSPALGLKAHGSDCGRGGKQPRSHAFQAGRSHRGDPQSHKSHTREDDNLGRTNLIWTDRRQAVCLFRWGSDETTPDVPTQNSGNCFARRGKPGDREMNRSPFCRPTPRREQKIQIILSHGNHSLRNAVIGSTAEARLAGTRQARAATPSSKKEAPKRMRGFVEAFSTH